MREEKDMRVVNFGSLNIDYVYRVDHFVQPGETMSAQSLQIQCGGKGLNQSIAVSRSGQKVHHAGLLGPEGARLAELLSGSGVDLRYLKHTDVPQGHAVIQVQPDGQNCIFLYGGSNQAVTPQEIDEVLMQLNAGDYLLLQNEIANLTYLLRAAARRGLRVVLNASPISDELLNADLSGVDWLVVNEIECAAMAGCGDAQAGYETLKQRYPSLGILLTLGSEGSVSWKDGTEVRQCAYPVKAVDTTGALHRRITNWLRISSKHYTTRASLSKKHPNNITTRKQKHSLPTVISPENVLTATRKVPMATNAKSAVLHSHRQTLSTRKAPLVAANR